MKGQMTDDQVIAEARAKQAHLSIDEYSQLPGNPS